FLSSSSLSHAFLYQTKPKAICLKSEAIGGVSDVYDFRRNIVKKRGLDSNFIIDSAGTIDYHEPK
ncbi:unnamed protein product, partial [Arabidopsis halleri]